MSSIERPSVEPVQLPDYELADEIEASTDEQLKALADPLRVHVLDLVLERAMGVTELARTLGKPKSTVAHHVDVLVDAGLLAVVRTRQVRAMTERLYGRTGRTINIRGRQGDKLPFVADALAEVDTELLDRLEFNCFTLRHARISIERAEEFSRRLIALAIEFTTLTREGDIEFAVLAGIYPTTRRTHRPAHSTRPADSTRPAHSTRPADSPSVADS